MQHKLYDCCKHSCKAVSGSFIHGEKYNCKFSDIVQEFYIHVTDIADRTIAWMALPSPYS